MPRLLLVRHAAPVIDPSIPSNEWALSQEGEDAASQLAQSLSRWSSSSVYSSPEARAIQTARLVGEEWSVAVRVEADLREVEGRSWANSRVEYERIASQYLRGEAVDGWEECMEAQRRIVATVQKLMDSGQDAIVVSHGLVLVLFLAWLLRVDAGTLVSMWRAIRFSDRCIVDWETREVVRPFGAPL